jgi:hypothetical protein
MRIPCLILLTAALAAADATKAELPCAVVADGVKSSWIPSGYMGDTGAIKMDDKSTDTPHSGATCLKVTFAKDNGWGGVVWQDPANDWGDQDGGRNLAGAKALAFWARGGQGGEKVKFGFGVLGVDKPFHDSGKGEFEATLTSEWAEYRIDAAGLDLSRIKTGFMWVVAGQGRTLTFFLDDVRWE